MSLSIEAKGFATEGGVLGQGRIKFGYRCFDRILLNGLIRPFQQPERVIGSFNAYRDGERITRKVYAILLSNLGNWVKNNLFQNSPNTGRLNQINSNS